MGRPLAKGSIPNNELTGYRCFRPPLLPFGIERNGEGRAHEGDAKRRAMPFFFPFVFVFFSLSLSLCERGVAKHARTHAFACPRYPFIYGHNVRPSVGRTKNLSRSAFFRHPMCPFSSYQTYLLFPLPYRPSRHLDTDSRLGNLRSPSPQP